MIGQIRLEHSLGGIPPLKGWRRPSSFDTAARKLKANPLFLDQGNGLTLFRGKNCFCKFLGTPYFIFFMKI